MPIFKRSLHYQRTIVVIDFKVLQRKKTVVNNLGHHFRNLDDYVARFEIPVADNLAIIALRQRWREYQGSRRSPLEVFTHSRAMKIASNLDKILNTLRAQTPNLAPSKAHLAEEQALAEKMARTPPVEHRTIYPVVEGPEGDFTISFKEGQENLDQGGFASIHIGYDESGRKLALKWPRPNWALGGRDDQERRMLRESQHWRELKHEFILPFLGTCRITTRLLLVSPFMDNGTLLKYTVKHPEADAPRLLCEAADAIAFLHRQDPKVVHGDINGSNILVSDEVHALLCDFGLTKTAQVETSDRLKGVGTLNYIAPELGLQQTPKTTASDVYAFGITIAAIFKGDPQPFRPGYLPGKEELVPERKDISTESGIIRSAVWAVVAKNCWDANTLARPSMEETAQKMREILSQ